MTAQAWDEPIPYTLTDAGWAAGDRPHLTTTEAAVRAGVTRTYMQQVVLRGDVDAIKVDRHWLVDVASLDEWINRPSRTEAPPTLPAGPLLRWVELLGGASALGVERGSAEEKALERAVDDGTVTERMGDHLAVQVLRMTPWEVWGAAYDL